MIHEEPISISGAGDRPVTHYMSLKIGTEFAAGAGLKVLLRRAEHGIMAEEGDYALDEYDRLHPFACLLDSSCQFAWRYEKNHQSMDVVVTSGEYLLQFWDVSGKAYLEWLEHDINLSVIPITIDISAYPTL